jgi:hypothetical protein
VGSPAVREETATRLRRALGAMPDVVEKRMVGGVSFSRGARMFCGATATGLMIRINPSARDAVLAERHVRPLELGGRMPLGFVIVEPEGYATDELLRAWIERALAVIGS